MEKVIPLIIYGYTVGMFSDVYLSSLFLSFVPLLWSVYKKKEELSLFLLTFITVLFVLFSIIPCKSSSLNEKTVIVGGKIISIPSYRGNENRGYNISITSYSDGEGNWYSGEGKLYVISDFGGEDLGDKVILKGTMMDGFFLASSSIIEERSELGRGRRRFLSLFSRSRERGSVGNLTSLLITGSSLDGGKEIQEASRALGLSHLFALSGMHLSFIYLAVGKPIEKVLGKKQGKVLTLMIIFLFVYINGFRPSLLRAFLLMILAPYFGVGYALVLSLWVMMKMVPGIVTDYGAALSFTALSGILLATSDTKGNKAVFMTTLGALSATVPFSLTLFSSWTLSSLILSIPGGIMIELIFFMIVINIFIPKLDYLISIIYDSIIKLPSILPTLTQYDLRLYWPLLFITLLLIFLNKAFPFIERWIIIKVCGISTMTAQRKSNEY